MGRFGGNDGSTCVSFHLKQNIFGACKQSTLFRVQEVWKTYRETPAPDMNASSSSATGRADKSLAGSSRSNLFTRKIYQRSIELRAAMDELESYLALGAEDIEADDVPLYWRKNSSKWPRLTSMAKDYLAIPATSSSGNDRLGVYRHSLYSEMMEASVCLRSWFKAGLMSPEDISREDCERSVNVEIHNTSGDPLDQPNEDATDERLMHWLS